MKRLIFTLLIFALTALYGQTPVNEEIERLQRQTEVSIIEQFQQVEPYFQEAYRKYPTIPRGILEAVSFTYTRFHHLEPDSRLHEEGEIPPTYGLMGLTLDGKGYFRDNLRKVSELSGVPIDKIIESPRDNVIAYASAFAALQQQLGITSSRLPDYFIILDELSELPIPTSTESRYPVMSQHYAYCLFVNNTAYRKAVQMELAPVDIMQVFSRDIDILQAPKVKIFQLDNSENQNIKSNAPNKTSIRDEETDYPEAIWNPAGSCNYSSRNGREISAVTIHYTQGTYAGSIAWFQNCTYNGVGAQASAHYVLRSIDGQITQMVREADKAWHVGNCNPYTIGLEHEAYGDIASYFTPAMYQSSAQLTRSICDRHGIPPLRMFYRDTLDDGTVLNYGLHSLGGETACTKIRGHQHFPDQTHTDPGPFWNWNLYFKLVNYDTPVTQHHTATGTLYDSGGPENDYGNDERQIITIEVENAEYIEIAFSEFELEENYDFLWIYDGNSVFSPLIMRCNTISPGIVRSSGNAITLEFRSDCATTASGWAATWDASIPIEFDEPPTTEILHNEDEWVTRNANIEFEDQDDHGLAYRFYQVMGYDGVRWNAVGNRGFACDNFDDLNSSTWETMSGNWHVANNQLVQSSTGTACISTTVKQDLSDVYLMDFFASVSNTQPEGELEILFHATNTQCESTGTAYSVAICPQRQQIEIRRWVNGDIVTVDSVQNTVTTSGENYFYRLIHDKRAGKILVFRGSALILQWQDPVPLTIAGQHIQFRTEGLCARLDNWRVYRSRTEQVVLSVGTGMNKDLPWQASNSHALGKIKSVVVDDALQFSTLMQKEVLVDFSRPVLTGTVNDGERNHDEDVLHSNTVSANWSASTDPNSGIVGYEYSVFSVNENRSARQSPILVGFTSQNNFSEPVRLKVWGQYYTQVRALNEAGLYSFPIRSDGFTYVPYNDLYFTTRNCGSERPISIVPNPCKESFVLTLYDEYIGSIESNENDQNEGKQNAENERGNTLIRIYDLVGHIIMEKTVTERNVTINSEEWPSGLYIIQVWNNGGMKAAEKIIKK